MNQWLFVWAAYGVTLAGVAGLLGWALLSCRRAEARAEGLGTRP
jgi:heme exporter protein CcmD